MPYICLSSLCWLILSYPDAELGATKLVDSEVVVGKEGIVFVVDDDPSVSMLVERWLSAKGFQIHSCESARSLRDALKGSTPDAVCLDLGLPDENGMVLLRELQERENPIPVIVLTGDDSLSSAVIAMRAGAFDYVPKPARKEHLVDAVSAAVATQKRRKSHVKLGKGTKLSSDDSGMVGESPLMQDLFREIRKVAPSEVNVAIRGESGTGKELVARSIHEQSTRGEGPFIAVNCAAIAESLQDSEFFGYEKGAFTGAQKTKVGKLEAADGGTLFLDEVAELSPSLQAKLLRALQEKVFERVGGTRSIRSDFRLLCATHRNLEEMISTSEFREDLYYRIAVIEVYLPPLRERLDDLPLLATTLLKRRATTPSPPRIGESAMQAMRSYSWPGNVRELDNVIQRALVLEEGREIEVSSLPRRLTKVQSPEVLVDAVGGNPKKMTLAELERWAIESAMKQHGGNTASVLEHLGIGRTTLYRKLKSYGHSDT